MTTAEEIGGLAQRYQVRCLNVYRKLFFDMQERDISPEIRDRAAKLVRSVKEEDWKEAISQTDAINYLFRILFKTGYLVDNMYESIAVDGKVLMEELQQITSSETGEEVSEPEEN